MFMGDVGAQALGAALGVLALMTNQWLIFPIIIAIPVATTLSTTLQVLDVYKRQVLGRGAAVVAGKRRDRTVGCPLYPFCFFPRGSQTGP